MSRAGRVPAPYDKPDTPSLMEVFYGPTLLVVEPMVFDKASILRLWELLRNTEFYRIKEDEPEKARVQLERGASAIASRERHRCGMVRWDWQAPDFSKEGRHRWGHMSAMEYTDFAAPNNAKFAWQENQFIFALYFWRPDVLDDLGRRAGDPFPPLDETPVDPKKVAFVLGKWQETLAVFRPRFAVIDDIALEMVPRQGEDLRKYAWGVSIYGPELVEKIGRDKLLKTPTYKVEELPWGGVWVQVAENPFLAPAEDKRKVEKYLELRKVFVGETTEG